MEKVWYNLGLTIWRLAIYGAIVMLLFNWLSPKFGQEIDLSYFQSCGMTLLCWILFKNEK